jgi:hypothetical protein
MSAVAAYPPNHNTEYLVRVEDSSVIFAPIKTRPAIKNFFVLETCEEYRFNPEAQKFLPSKAKGTLLVKKGDRTFRLEGFTAKSLEELLHRVAKRIKTHYLRVS